MTFAVLSVLATLIMVLALNRERFRAMGSQTVAKMLLIWAAIIIGLGVTLRLLGF
jgi:hypothetical protein